MTLTQGLRGACACLVVALFGVHPALAHAKDPMLLYRARCAACHGDDGKAQTAVGKEAKAADFTTAAFQKARTDDALRKSILEGRPGTKMLGFAGKLSPDELESLIKVIRGFGRGAR